jgi:CRP-like cAMP-binding protein
VDGVQFGAVLGERAVLEHSPRAATLTAMTQVKIAEAPAEAADLAARPRLAQLHHREVTESSASS